MTMTLHANPDRIYQARLASDMSRADLAYAIRRVSGGSIKATERSIGRWEKGLHSPRDGVIAAIAKATGQDLTFFYSTNGDEADDEDGEPG